MLFGPISIRFVCLHLSYFQVFSDPGTKKTQELEACCVVTNLLSALDAQGVLLVRLVRDLQLVHHFMEKMRWKCVWRAFLDSVVESRRDVQFDRHQQLHGGETRMDVERAAIEEFGGEALRSVGSVSLTMVFGIACLPKAQNRVGEHVRFCLMDLCQD